jgi:hypothetical protein
MCPNFGLKMPPGLESVLSSSFLLYDFLNLYYWPKATIFCGRLETCSETSSPMSAMSKSDSEVIIRRLLSGDYEVLRGLESS